MSCFLSNFPSADCINIAPDDPFGSSNIKIFLAISIDISYCYARPTAGVHMRHCGLKLKVNERILDMGEIQVPSAVGRSEQRNSAASSLIVRTEAFA